MSKAIIPGKDKIDLMTEDQGQGLEERRGCNYLVEFRQCFQIIILSIDDKHQSTTIAEYHVGIERWIEEIYLPREVPYLELHETESRKECWRSNGWR